MTLYVMAVGLLITILIFKSAAYLSIIPIGYVANRELPRVSREIIEKFTTFDDELGHIPRQDSVTYGRYITGKTYTTKCSYNSDGARASRFAPHEPALISSFGDSFCQCKGVKDAFTRQRHPEEKLGLPVRNDGVGGHGLDRALLRYPRSRRKPLGQIIIFAVSPCTIERVVDIYKHHIEVGFVLGVKPQTRLKDEARLELLNNSSLEPRHRRSL